MKRYGNGANPNSNTQKSRRSSRTGRLNEATEPIVDEQVENREDGTMITSAIETTRKQIQLEDGVLLPTLDNET